MSTMYVHNSFKKLHYYLFTVCYKYVLFIIIGVVFDVFAVFKT